MMKELKPCPFCGERLKVVRSWADHPRNDCVLATCDDGGPLSIAEDEYRAWNRRAEDRADEEGR
jgi:hypothetical protein